MLLRRATAGGAASIAGVTRERGVWLSPCPKGRLLDEPWLIGETAIEKSGTQRVGELLLTLRLRLVEFLFCLFPFFDFGDDELIADAHAHRVNGGAWMQEKHNGH
jgi:hypothetical protein